MDKKFLIHEAVTTQGTFQLKGYRWWFATNSVFITDDGMIIWEMSYPNGTLIQYPDKTKRFISNTWHNK